MQYDNFKNNYYFGCLPCERIEGVLQLQLFGRTPQLHPMEAFPEVYVFFIINIAFFSQYPG